MKKLNLLPTLLLLSIAFANAQSLPNKQEKSLRAPANIKIDGMAAEWGNKFQAHNTATEIDYSMANDDDNLYLAIRAADPLIIQKILKQRLVFTVSNSVKKDAQHQVLLTFPILQEEDTREITSGLNYKPKNAATDPAVIHKRNDSLVTVMNNEMTYFASLINVKGIPSTTDYLFNKELGVQAVALFDADKAYNLEIAIPIKYLELPKDQPAVFSYNIKLNGVDGTTVKFSADSNSVYISTKSSEGDRKVGMRATPEIKSFVATLSTTDFWGEYTLAKK